MSRRSRRQLSHLMPGVMGKRHLEYQVDSPVKPFRSRKIHLIKELKKKGDLYFAPESSGVGTLLELKEIPELSTRWDTWLSNFIKQDGYRLSSKDISVLLVLLASAGSMNLRTTIAPSKVLEFVNLEGGVEEARASVEKMISLGLLGRGGDYLELRVPSR